MKLFVILTPLVLSFCIGICSTENVDCSEENLSLNFSNTQIVAIGQNFISSPIIKCLNLEGNQIQEVKKGSFDNVPNLIYLNMAHNYITYIFNFGGHPKLETLLLNNQEDHQYKSIIVSGYFPQLRYLHLQGNRIESCEGMRLETGGGYGTVLKNAFPKLIYLDLSDNSITGDNINIILPESLTHLYLHNNNFDQLGLHHLTNLTHLTLDNNKITYLSDIISNLQNLEYLSVSQNQLESVNFVFQNTRNLLFLNLSQNDLNSIRGDVFEDLIALETLDLSNTLLESVPFSMNLQQLTTCFLNCNRIRVLPRGSFTQLPSLRKLYLTNNEISVMEEGAFSNINLEELHLGSNNLDTLPPGWSKTLNNLHYLNLEKNNFKFLEALSLSDTVPLLNLYLHGNTLEYMQVKSFYDIPENITIHFVPKIGESSATCNRVQDRY